MDYLDAAHKAFQARQFIEAERFYLQGLKTIDQKDAEPVLARLYEIARSLRPTSAHSEKEAWLRSLKSAQKWQDILSQTLQSLSRGYEFELRAEAFFQLGQYGLARTTAFDHVAHLQEKNAYPRLLTFSRLYQERFPHTVAFRFQEITALVNLNLVDELSDKTKALLDSLMRHWGKWEDVGSAGRSQLLDTLVTTLSHPARTSGRLVLLAHTAKLTLLNVSGGHFLPEDWKRLVEVLLHNDGWEDWALALESALSQQDNEVAQLIKDQVRRRKGFSFVKWSQGRTGIKQWWAQENARAGEVEASEEFSGEAVEASEFTPSPSVELIPAEDDVLAEESAISYLRVSPPTPDMIPDLIVTYLMMDFGRVVDWLVDYALKMEEQTQLQKKVRYLGAMRAIGNKNYHRALAFLTEMTGSDDLSIEELQELKYAQGAVWRMLGNERMSRALFDEVEKIAPGYRRLRERTW